MKYSVIIPVYNAEKTLDRCIQSLLDQKYPDAEIILVDDGSTDHSGHLCQAYANMNNQITYIEKENGGVSSARNAGLDVAAGEYILFVDSDDYVPDQYFTGLDQLGDGWEYLIFSYYIFDGKLCTPHIRTPYHSEDIHGYLKKLASLLCRKIIYCPWNKRYKRDIIERNNIRFHKQLSIGEDALFNLCYALRCNSCRIVDVPLYCVSLENEHSLSRKIRSDLTEQLTLCEQEMRRAIHNADITEPDRQELLRAMNFLGLSEIYSDAKRMHLSGISLAERHRFISRKCRETNAKKLAVPKSRFCTMISLPVKLHLVTVIDLVAWRLAN